MTVFTVQLFVVLCAVGGVQKLATQFYIISLTLDYNRKQITLKIYLNLTAFEAHFMPFVTSSNSLFGGIN